MVAGRVTSERGWCWLPAGLDLSGGGDGFRPGYIRVGVVHVVVAGWVTSEWGWKWFPARLYPGRDDGGFQPEYL